MRLMTRQSGFTLIELVVTLVISAIVVSFVGPRLRSRRSVANCPSMTTVTS